MATFDTPKPISVEIDVAVGNVRIAASDRADTVVEVHPTDNSKPADVEAARQVRVSLTGGTLLVKAPATSRRRPTMFGRGGSVDVTLPTILGRDGSVDVTLELPEGSQVRAGSVSAAFHCEGRLGECRVDTVNSEIRLDQTGPLRLTAASAEISVARMVGDAKINIGSGGVRVEEIDGTAAIKNDYGTSTIGEVTGSLLMTGTNGDVYVERAHGYVEARTAHGNLRIGEVARGSVVLTTALGEVEVGIGEGTAGKLDLRTVSGQVHNSLESVAGPGESDRVVDVRVQTFGGSIVIRRSSQTKEAEKEVAR